MIGSRRSRQRVLALCALLAFVIATPLVVARLLVRAAANGRVFANPSDVPACDVALVLGAEVHDDGSPSQLLKDRLDTAIRLCKSGRVKRLMMSGDDRQTHNRETTCMRKYALSHGISAESIVCDPRGVRTFDSILRAREVFGLKKAIVVSQRFHLDRALFLCDREGLSAFGACADVEAHDDLISRIWETPKDLRAVLDACGRRSAHSEE